MLKENQAIRLIKLNPQLRKINILFCYNITLFFFQTHCNFTPNLEKLSFISSNNDLQSNVPMIHIGKLRHLKSLIIFSHRKVPLKKLMGSLIESNAPIEILAIWGGKNDSVSGLNILQLKLLKKTVSSTNVK